MSRYIARVHTNLRHGIHRVGGSRGDTALPAAERVEIRGDTGGVGYFLFRYSSTGEPCGDTWHANLEEVFSQAEFEYGLSERDFIAARDGNRP